MAISAAIMGALGASARNWVLVATETFDTNPSGKYTIRSGSPSVSWDSANARLLVSNGATQGFVAWDALGNYAGKVAFEIDVLFSADSQGLKHFGMFCDSGASGINGYRFAAYQASIMFSRFAGSTETVIGYFTNTASFATGNTYTLRFERDASNNWTAYINGVKCPTTFNNTTYDGIRPGFFAYGSTIYINELRVYQ